MLALLLACVLAGAYLRLHDLAGRSLWADELFTLEIAAFRPLVPSPETPTFRRTDIHHLNSSDSFWTIKAAEQNPPLQELLEKLAVQLMGISEWAARLPGALASTLVLGLVAWKCWQVRGTPQARVLAWLTLLISLHPALVLYAGEARAYSLGTALLTLAVVQWAQRWQNGLTSWHAPRWSELLLLIMACHTHYLAAWMAWLLVGSDLVAGFRTRRVGAALLSAVVVGIAMLPWLGLNAHTILFTARGGVAWAQGASGFDGWSMLRDAGSAWHWPWLLLATLTGLVCLGRAQAAAAPAPDTISGCNTSQLVGLALVIVLYGGGAYAMSAKAGMAHPRFYLYGLPVLLLGIACVLARLRGPATWVVALAVMATSLATVRLTTTFSTDDFRSMTQEAVHDTDATTLYVHQWTPNRPMYRVYLQRYLRVDPGERLIGISDATEAPALCARLRPAHHVVLISHIWGRQVMDALAAECASEWPRRSVANFHNTFTEHWRRP